MEQNQKQSGKIFNANKQLHSVHCTTIRTLSTLEISESEFIFLDAKVHGSRMFIRESKVDF